MNQNSTDKIIVAKRPYEYCLSLLDERINRLEAVPLHDPPLCGEELLELHEVRAHLQQFQYATENPGPTPTLERDLAGVLNCYSQENASDTPDFILAKFLLGCLDSWNTGLRRREEWYGRSIRHKANPSVTPPDPDIDYELPVMEKA